MTACGTETLLKKNQFYIRRIRNEEREPAFCDIHNGGLIEFTDSRHDKTV